MSSWERTDASQDRDGRADLKLVDMDELSELQLIAQNEIVVLLGERHVRRMRGIGNLEVEAVVGPELTASQRRHDADNLQ